MPLLRYISQVCVAANIEHTYLSFKAKKYANSEVTVYLIYLTLTHGPIQLTGRNETYPMIKCFREGIWICTFHSSVFLTELRQTASPPPLLHVSFTVRSVYVSMRVCCDARICYFTIRW